NFYGQLHFTLALAAKKSTGRYIHAKHQGLLALFFKLFDERSTRAGRNIPIDLTDIITVGIGAHFRKFHALPLENGLVFATKYTVDHAFGANFNFTHFF